MAETLAAPFVDTQCESRVLTWGVHHGAIHPEGVTRVLLRLWHAEGQGALRTAKVPAGSPWGVSVPRVVSCVDDSSKLTFSDPGHFGATQWPWSSTLKI